ncbi:MAG: hypothetical protein IKZ89_05295 [Bacteroidaceae bacterium]|nr:hypothetical protein [Bacteroidaceae bacterium]
MTNLTQDLRQAVEDIKTAILQGQYEASKGVNRIQLAVYFGIGKYVSQHTRKGVWGTGALETISNQLRRELPGLRGFSATSLKKMRLFYDNWILLDANSSVATDELVKPASVLAELETSIGKDVINKSSISTDRVGCIDIHHNIQISNITDFPVEDFFKIPFSHHVEIFTGVKTLNARYYYIHRTAEEHLSIDSLKQIIKADAYNNQQHMPSNFHQTISNSAMMKKAVVMFKDSYLLDFINVEEIGLRDSIDVDERVVEKEIVNKVQKGTVPNCINCTIFYLCGKC